MSSLDNCLVCDNDGMKKKTLCFTSSCEKAKYTHEKIYKRSALSSSHHLYHKKIKISGFRDKEFQKQLEIRGADLQTNISKKTDFVIVKDMDDLSEKVQKAVENNIRVVTKSEFEKKYM